MSDVRPFPARVVRPEWARRLVSGLSELPEDTGTLPPVAPVDPAAYDQWEPALYVYRQERGDLLCTGVVCDVAVSAFVGGQVRGHEAVQAQRVESLVHHQTTTDAPPALVALLHHAGPAYARTLDEVCGTPPILDFAGPSGMHQTVWRVPPGRCDREPRRRADRGGPLHRRRPPPGRGRARGVAPGRRAR